MVERLPFHKQEKISELDRWRIKADGWREQAWRQDEFLIGTKQVYITGLMHDRNTFEMHKSEIEETVRKSSIVLLEGYSKRAISDIIPESFPTSADISTFRMELGRAIKENKNIHLDLQDITDDMIRREIILYYQNAEIEKHEFYQFYDKVKQIAALYRKEIALADPMHMVKDRAAEAVKSGSERLSENFPWEESRAEQDAREGILYAGLISAALAGFVSRLVSQKGPINRRSFLKLSVAGAAAAALGGASTVAEQIEIASFKTGGRLDRTKNPLGFFRYNALTDYREVCVGLALQRLAAMTEQSQEPIAVFFGRNHIDSIRHYATSPIEARLRLRAYPQQISYAEPTLTIYNFDDQKREWFLKQKESLAS